MVKSTKSHKVLRNKAFKIASDLRYVSYQRGLASMVYKFWNMKKYASVAIKNESISSQQWLVNELSKPIIKKFDKRKVY